jgi:predicted DNA-binding transcriptional regulator AlpA
VQVETVVLPAEGFVRLPTVLKVMGISKTRWYRGIREGWFPKPVALGPNVSMWDVADIRACIARLKAEAAGPVRR